jgi:enamine deaminase RidA (YjgF/YER057c/UK114 family)
MNVEKKLEAMGIAVPPFVLPAGALLVPVRQLGNALYVSGQLPAKDGKLVYTGKVGAERTLEEAQEAAKLCAINALAALKFHLGDLDKIKNIIKLPVFVNCTTDFTQQPQVANGASQLFIDAFGEAGQHARTAIGTNQLPMDVTVEIELIAEV